VLRKSSTGRDPLQEIRRLQPVRFQERDIGPGALRALRAIGVRIEGKLLLQGGARDRGCAHAYTDTLSFRAPDFWQRNGYAEFRRLDGMPTEHARLRVSKIFSLTVDITHRVSRENCESASKRLPGSIATRAFSTTRLSALSATSKNCSTGS